MADIVIEALILDLLEWLASGERRYEEFIDAWRTSCPRLPVWEDATIGDWSRASRWTVAPS